MPELPEVETIKTLLYSKVVNATINEVQVLYKRMIKSDFNQFINDLKGKTIINITRKGKFLIFHLTDNLILLSHLRMEGKYREVIGEQPLSNYTRVIFFFNDGRKLVYEDSRCFGTMKLTDTKSYLTEPPLNQLGEEPFTINVDSFFNIINKRNIPIKQLLLNQTLISGLGNIYVDEALFLAKVHPLTPGRLITKTKLLSLVHYSKQVLNQAIIDGGSTVKSYRPMQGVHGKFQTRLLAYGKNLQSCINCRSRMVKIKIGGRGTTFCPHCQINPDQRFVIAITGMMSSGKSTLLNIASDMGYPTISADQIVKKLYQQPEVISDVNQLLGGNVIIDNKLDHEAILQTIITNPILKKRLEKYVHPLVKKNLISFINNTKKGPLFIEVPLLYEANFDDLVNYVIGVKVSYLKQKQLIENRYKNDPSPYLSLAASGSFNLYQSFTNDLLNNEKSLEDFIAQGRKSIIQAIEYFNKYPEDPLA